MRAGKLRHKLLIQTNTPSADSVTGEDAPQDGWATTWTAYGEIIAVTGGETWLAETTSPSLTHVIKVRGHSSVTILPSMRIVFGTRKFGILRAQNMSEIDKRWQIQVQEIVEGGLDGS